jgi:hypothetical protein
LGDNEYIINILKFKKIKMSTLFDFEKIKKENSKCFWILFQEQNFDFCSELHHATLGSQSKFQGNSFKLTEEEIPIFHPTQFNE